MTTYKISLSQTVYSLSAIAALVIGTNLCESVPAVAGENLSNSSLISLQFQPPGDSAPSNTSGGGTRGGVRFQAPGDSAPTNTSGGGTRGSLRFQPPGEPAPTNTSGGGTRGIVGFQPPGEPAPTNTSGGGTRGLIGFQAPGEPAPTNTNSGGTRTAALSNLTPLIPQAQIGRTVAARPTFFVYVPPTAAKEVFFSLQDEGRNYHYQTTLKTSSEGGIVKIALPDDAPELEIGKNYKWFFVAIAPGDILRPDSQGVSGWVKRVAPPTNSAGISSLNALELATLYAESGIWYDTIDLLSAAKLSQPDNAMLATEWKDLLEQVGLEAIATQSINELL